MSVLLDTSIWIDYFRGAEPTATHVAALLESDEVALCGPILAELLAGTAADQRETLWLALVALPNVELDLAAWRASGEHADELRRRGEMVPLLDVLIAVAAIRSGATLWTRDADFDRIAGIVPELVLHRADS